MQTESLEITGKKISDLIEKVQEKEKQWRDHFSYTEKLFILSCFTEAFNVQRNLEVNEMLQAKAVMIREASDEDTKGFLKIMATVIKTADANHRKFCKGTLENGKDKSLDVALELLMKMLDKKAKAQKWRHDFLKSLSTYKCAAFNASIATFEYQNMLNVSNFMDHIIVMKDNFEKFKTQTIDKDEYRLKG